MSGTLLPHRKLKKHFKANFWLWNWYQNRQMAKKMKRYHLAVDGWVRINDLSIRQYSILICGTVKGGNALFSLHIFTPCKSLVFFYSVLSRWYLLENLFSIQAYLLSSMLNDFLVIFGLFKQCPLNSHNNCLMIEVFDNLHV